MVFQNTQPILRTSLHKNLLDLQHKAILGNFTFRQLTNMHDSIQIFKEETKNALSYIMAQVETLKEETVALKQNASEAAIPSGRLKLPTELTVSLYGNLPATQIYFHLYL